MPDKDIKMPDAISLLKSDHRKVEDLFEQYENTSNKRSKAKIAQEICLELAVHTAIEEEIFYPALKGKIEDDVLDEAYVEHDGAKVLVAELMAGTPEDMFYDAKVTVLSEEIKHHVKEEEQRGGMFAQARKTDVDMDALGAQLAQRKKELQKTYKTDGIPVPQTRSMKGTSLPAGSPVKYRAA